MFLGNLSHHSPVRRSGRPNVSVLTSRACSSSRIGRITRLGVHPPSLSIRSFCLCPFLLLNMGNLVQAPLIQGNYQRNGFAHTTPHGLGNLVGAF